MSSSAIEPVTRSGHPCTFGGMFADTTKSTGCFNGILQGLMFYVCLHKYVFAKAFCYRGPVGFTDDTVKPNSTAEVAVCLCLPISRYLSCLIKVARLLN